MGVLVQDRIVVPGPIVNFAAAGVANAAVVFTIPALVGQLVGTKSVKIYRVNLYNNAPAGNTQVLIGTGVGVGFAALLPALDSFNGLNDAYGPETDLIEAESFANVTAYVVALAGGSIDVQVEVIVVG
jgi:hypothetical protein